MSTGVNREMWSAEKHTEAAEGQVLGVLEVARADIPGKGDVEKVVEKLGLEP
jgi:hypothetical protein